MGLEKAGSCKPRIGIPPLPHPSPAGNKANGRPKRKEKKRKLNLKVEPECKGRSALFPGGGIRWAGGASRESRGHAGRAPPWRCQGEETQHEALPPYKRSRPPLPLLKPEPGSPRVSPSASNADGGGGRPSQARSKSGVFKSSKDGKQAKTPAREGSRPPPSLRDPTRAGPQSQNCPCRLSSARGEPGCGKPERREPPLQL